MVKIALTSMNVSLEITTATKKRIASIPKAPSTVNAKTVSLEMESTVQTLTNVNMESIVVMTMPTVLTNMAHTFASAKQVTMETVLFAKTSMNALKEINVTPSQSV